VIQSDIMSHVHLCSTYVRRSIHQEMRCHLCLALAQSGVLPLVVERIETEVKPALATSFLNCTVGFLDTTNQVLWIRVKDGLQISQNELIVTQNKLDSFGNPKYEVHKREGRSPAVPQQYGSTSIWTYMLIIRQLHQNDAGNYRCQIVVQGVKNYPYRDGTLIVQGKFPIQRRVHLFVH
jgi:hypothetical protein